MTWLVLVLSLMAAGIMVLTLSARKSTEASKANIEDRLLVESAVKTFFQRYFYDPDERVYQNARFQIRGVDLKVDVSYEAGKVNFNRASLPLISAMFASNGVQNDEAIRIASAVIDWRDADNVTLPDGAERDLYNQNSIKYLPRNGPFETVGEVGRVWGLDYNLFRCLRPLITVYSLNADLDLVTADGRARDVVAWAYANNWFDEPWPDPAEAIDEGALLASSDIGGRAMTLTIEIAGDANRSFQQIVRFKSLSGKSFSRLTSLRRVNANEISSTCL